MSICDDFDGETAAQLLAEVVRFGADCWYDETRKKIIYRSDTAALNAYMVLQQEEMEKHKWIESEKARRDMGTASLGDWIRHHSAAFSIHWQKTHLFIPARNNVLEEARQHTHRVKEWIRRCLHPRATAESRS